VAAAPPNSILIEVGPAAALPFPATHFDVILSVFGIQFEPNPAAVIDEIARVAKPGAMLGLALWNTDSPLGNFLRLLDRFVPASPETQVLRAWGVAGEVEQRLAGRFGELEFRFGNAPLYADSPEDLWQHYLTVPSPTRDAIDSLTQTQRERLTSAAIEQFSQYVDFTGRVEWPREYLLVRGLRSF
jgi:SAM-dependent methyltransferase